MPTIEEITKQIRNQGSISKFLARREVKQLPSVLWEDEIVENIIQGTYDNAGGILVASNKRLIFINKGIVKLTVEDFPYDKITSIQYKVGVLLGTISIYASGNKAEIRNIEKHATQPFAEFIRARITHSTLHAAMQTPNTQTAAASNDTIATLERLGMLHEKGILSKEEFLNEKKKILSSR